MSRLLLLLGPGASSLSGVAIGLVIDWCIAQIFVYTPKPEPVLTLFFDHTLFFIANP